MLWHLEAAEKQPGKKKEKETKLHKIFHIKLVKVCVCAGRTENGPSPAGSTGLFQSWDSWCSCWLCRCLGKSQQAALNLCCPSGVAASQTLPRCSHNKELSRTIPEISDPAEDGAVQLLCWLWSQQTFPSSGLQMFGKEDAGWMNFYFVWDFHGTDIYIPSFFLRSLLSHCCSPPLSTCYSFVAQSHPWLSGWQREQVAEFSFCSLLS